MRDVDQESSNNFTEFVDLIFVQLQEMSKSGLFFNLGFEPNKLDSVLPK